MARVPDVSPAEMTAEQKRVSQEIAGARGGVVRGPFAIWLRNPELADHANQFGNAFRLTGKLDKRLFELMVASRRATGRRNTNGSCTKRMDSRRD